MEQIPKNRCAVDHLKVSTLEAFLVGCAVAVGALALTSLWG